jgi:hypothetical protein
MFDWFKKQTPTWKLPSPQFPMLQCVWPLKSGLYPWDGDYSPEGAEFQPYLGLRENSN